MSIASEFLQKPFHLKALLVRASLLTIYYRRVIARSDFQKIAEKLGEFRYETPHEAIEDPYPEELRWVMYAIRKWAFWDTKCFDRALAARKMLNRKGYACTLYMGVRKEPEGGMSAHAWVRCGDVYVSGGSGIGYAVTGIYGSRIPAQIQ